jgi:hypothetical protein
MKLDIHYYFYLLKIFYSRNNNFNNKKTLHLNFGAQ